LPALDAQTLAMTPLADDEAYSLVPEGGLVRAQAGDGRASLSGAQWQALQQALDQAAPFGPVMRAVVDVNASLKPQLRALLHYHCGVQTLRTRQLMKDLQAL
jgi:DNA repair protein RecO (recombination protein O)